MYQTGDTIQNTLDEIQLNELVLPAIQREFVWRPEQIYRLFDSLMQGYPFGTFLYWRVRPENSGNFNFYDFVLHYHERDNRHCRALPDMPDRRLTAVLDGQQRLTALNIGLRGSMAWKQPRLWRNNPRAFPSRRLYLDLLWRPNEDDEEGLKYRFKFLTREQIDEAGDGECWFRVQEVLYMENAGPAITRWLNERLPQEQMLRANETLYELYQVVREKRLIAFYEERSQELEKVLQIFIRMNEGGTPLSYSDLLLSVAVAQWSQYDAREEILTLVDELNLNRIGGMGFSFSKNLVLKAGLMLSDIGSVGFKVDNFNRGNMDIFENNWDNIKHALTLTVQLVSTFGFSGQNLTAHNAILPIAYYLYRRNPGETYLRQSRFAQDREAIRGWLIRSLLKSGVWGSGSDTLLTALRQIIKDSSADKYPVVQIQNEMELRGKPLVFHDMELEKLLDMQYGNGLTFALLSLIFQFVDLRNQFHIDHIFPRAHFTEQRLRTSGVADSEIEDFMQKKDGLANLQLLAGTLNNEKGTKMPAEWLSQMHTDSENKREYEERHMLGEVPESIRNFGEFYARRRNRLKEKIEKLLGRQPATSSPRT